jgi:hypothetical protein
MDFFFLLYSIVIQGASLVDCSCRGWLSFCAVCRALFVTCSYPRFLHVPLYPLSLSSLFPLHRPFPRSSTSRGSSALLKSSLEDYTSLCPPILVGKIICKSLPQKPSSNRTSSLMELYQRWNDNRRSVAKFVLFFCFARHAIIDLILDQCPWNGRGCLNLKPWPPFVSFSEIELPMAPFWVQIQGLPQRSITANIAKSIGEWLDNLLWWPFHHSLWAVPSYWPPSYLEDLQQTSKQ